MWIIGDSYVQHGGQRAAESLGSIFTLPDVSWSGFFPSFPLPAKKCTIRCLHYPLWRQHHVGGQQGEASQHDGGPAPALPPAPWHEDPVFVCDPKCWWKAGANQ